MELLLLPGDIPSCPHAKGTAVVCGLGRGRGGGGKEPRRLHAPSCCLVLPCPSSPEARTVLGTPQGLLAHCPWVTICQQDQGPGESSGTKTLSQLSPSWQLSHRLCSLSCFDLLHKPSSHNSYLLVFQDFSLSERILGRNEHHIPHRPDPGHPRGPQVHG